MSEKRQTPAQRVANPVWLRAQITELIQDCDDNIAEDQKRADNAGGDRDKYLTRVETHRHWKRALERVLRGKTFREELRDAVKQPVYRRSF